MKHPSRGMTIIETIIVVSILATLSVLSYSYYVTHSYRASFIAALQETTSYVLDSAKNMSTSQSITGTCGSATLSVRNFSAPSRISRISVYGYNQTLPDGTNRYTCLLKAQISATEPEPLSNQFIQIQLTGDATFLGKRCFSTVNADYLDKNCVHVNTIDLLTADAPI